MSLLIMDTVGNPTGAAVPIPHQEDHGASSGKLPLAEQELAFRGLCTPLPQSSPQPVTRC